MSTIDPIADYKKKLKERKEWWRKCKDQHGKANKDPKTPPKVLKSLADAEFAAYQELVKVEAQKPRGI